MNFSIEMTTEKEEVETIVSLFQLGEFTLSSGRKSKFKIDCTLLLEEDWRVLACLIADLVGPFASCEGVPRGGLQLATQLQELRSKSGGHLIVDDVLTTGASMNRLKGQYAPTTAHDTYPTQDKIRGVVVFARGKCPDWVTPFFQAHEMMRQ